MQNKRRQALAERVFKVAGDYKKVSGATLRLGRTAFENGGDTQVSREG